MNKALVEMAKKLKVPHIMFDSVGEADFLLPVADWINPLLVEKYEENRNVDRRTNKPYLNADQLERVDMRVNVTGAVFEGRIINIDSNARVKNWRAKDEDGQPLLAYPQGGKVKVKLVLCQTWKEVGFIYDQMNSEDSKVTPKDKIDTAQLRAGYTPQSNLTSRMSTSTFTMVGCDRRDIDASYADWKAELTLLDSLNIDARMSSKDPMRKKYSVGILAAMLETTRQDMNKALAFWAAYRDGDTSVTGIKALLATVEKEADNAGGAFNVRLNKAANNSFMFFRNKP